MADVGKSRHGLARGAFIASLAVMGSRLLGLVREQIFAFFFGASREYDAFLTAFRIPNLLRDLLAEGALSSAFVTVFVKELADSGKAKAFSLANSVVNALTLLLAVLVTVGMCATPAIVGGIAMGFDAEKAALATTLTRLMFPYIVLVALAAVAMGMLNAQSYYAVPQSASTFFNVGSITVGLTSAACLAPDYMLSLWHRIPVSNPAAASRAMMGMALGTLAGGVAQWSIQLPTLWRTGYRWRPVLEFRNPAFRHVLRLMGPAVIGAAAVQLNVFVNSNFASTLGDRPISWLNYAFRLMQFPIGVFGVAVMTAALPAMSRDVSGGNHEAFGATLTRSLELVLLLTLPSMAGLVVLGEPVIRVIYEHGRFAVSDTRATALALSAYALGLPGYAAIKLIQPAFVALGDARTPMYTSLAAVLLNVLSNFLFVRVVGIGHMGLALSTSIMATLNVTTLVLVLENRQATLQTGRLAGQIWRMAAATLAMAVAAAALYAGLQHVGFDQGSHAALVELAILLPVCCLIYLGAAKALGVEALQAAWQTLNARRRR